MLYGGYRSRKPADQQHPFGYGHEFYFWTLIVGILIFAVGGGMSIVTGLSHIQAPRPPGNTLLSYAVLVIAMAFEGTSWYYGLKAFRAEQRGRGILETIQATKNPASFSVLLEDSAALLGLVFALAGIFLAERLAAPWIDGASSMLIGVLLCLMSLVMVYESKGLLVGEGMEKQTLERLRAMVQADPAVERVNKLTTMYLGPEDVLLAIELRFHSQTRVTDIRASLARLKRAIQERYPRIRRIYLDSSAIADEE